MPRANDIRCNFCGEPDSAAGKMLERADRGPTNRQVRICLACAKLAISALTPLYESTSQLPVATDLVLAWKPIINGWDIVLGRKVVSSPELFTHWQPVPPPPEHR